MAKAKLSDVFVSGFLAFGVVVALLWFVGITLNPGEMSVLFTGFLIFSVITMEAIDRSVGFGLITLALLLVLATFLPDWVSDPFVEFFDRATDLVGVSVGEIDAVGFAVLTIGFTILMLVIRYRITGTKKSIRNAAVLAGNDIQLYIREYLTFARIVALTVLSAVVIMFQQTGQVLGSTGDVVADVPYIVSNLATLLGGFLSLGGDLPFLGNLPLFGSLGPLDFLVFGIVVISLAAAVDERGRGRMSQFLRNRGL